MGRGRERRRRKRRTRARLASTRMCLKMWALEKSPTGWGEAI